MLHACALYCRKAPIGIEHASCLTIQLTRILTFGAALCSFVSQLCVCVCVCVCMCVFTKCVFTRFQVASNCMFCFVCECRC